MKTYLSIAISVIVILQSFSQKIPKKPEGEWINKITIKDSKSEKNGASEYLLIDYQYNLITQEIYSNYAIKVLNSEGIQEFSDINVSFDPSFQQLSFHKIQVVRNGVVIDKLKASTIKSFQRENDLERSLYDGSITAVVNLTDIRKDDIITYAYTIKGFNPVNKGNFSTVIYQQYTSPVHQLYDRIIAPKNLELYLKPLSGATEAKTIQTKNGKEYIWDIDGTNFYQYDTNTPYWLNEQKRVSVSTFKDWNEISKLLLPYYQVNKNRLVIPSINDKKFTNKEDEILELIRFVQDEIRYLGFESGIGAYKPNEPKKILTQRYGDCKDKSLLLVKLLRQSGLTSYPFLVNTSNKGDINGMLPGLNVFDHCIVYFEHDNKEFYVDPTATNEGGNLQNLSYPKYSNGLLLKTNAKSLTPIKKDKKLPSLKIEETITMDSIGGEAIYLIKSIYTGSKANDIRDYFNSNTKESIDNEFLNFYSSIYPSINKSQPLRFTDNLRNETNEVVIEEYYEIPSFWTKNDSNYLIAETQPVVLQSLIDYPNSPKRDLPYYIGTPHNFEQETTIKLPEYWNIKDDIFRLDEESFSYSNQIKLVGKTVVVNHKYKLKTETISPEKVINFLSNHEKINNRILYQISYSDENETSNTSNISLIILISVLILSLILGKKLYEDYNPSPIENPSNLPIGGWLVLPLIGLTLTPFILIFQSVNEGFFNSAIWTAFDSSEYENASLINLFIGFEFVVNIAFLVFSILLIILAFSKRTSFPKLMIFFYIFNIVFQIADFAIYEALFPDELTSFEDNSETYKDIFKAIIGGAIWIPYFMTSTRVKNTFTKIYSGKKLINS